MTPNSVLFAEVKKLEKEIAPLFQAAREGKMSWWPRDAETALADRYPKATPRDYREASKYNREQFNKRNYL